MNGILVIDKPQEFTSFDVVAVCRRLCSTRKIGHTGTLDPMATGVLVLLVGTSTKALNHIPDKSKTYIAKFIPGTVTETGDIWGQVISRQNAEITAQQIENCLPFFRGDILQTPPMYSAVKINGERLYKLAREGKTVERQQRPATIYRLELCGFDEQTGEFEILVECSAGTYIRTIITDIGEKLGCGAAMTSLRRINACSFGIEQAVTLDEAKRLYEENRIESAILPIDRAFLCYDSIELNSKQSFRFLNGAAVDLGSAGGNKLSGEIFRLYNRDGVFLGLGKITDTGLIKSIYLDIRGQ